MAYLLDSNVFIQAKNLHYGFDFCPAFWDWLTQQGDAGNVLSLMQVKSEILGGEDELVEWVSGPGAHLFQSVDQATAQEFGPLSQWTETNLHYDPVAKSAFQQVADYFLVAHAKAHSLVLVTHEKPANSRKRVMIPSACAAMGVDFVNTAGMLRRERARFILAGR